MGLCNELLKKIIEYNQPEEWRESTKILTATFLAISSWSLLGWLAYSQFTTSQSFAERLAKAEPEDTARIALIKDANETVNKTASSLYALLIPIASAITGYFFVSSGTFSDKKERSNLPPPSQQTTDLKLNPPDSKP